MSKFVKNLTQDADGVKAQRASIIASATKSKQESLVNKLKEQKLELDTKLLNLTDLSPDNSFSLKPGGDNYDPERWVIEMQNTQIAILNKKIEIEVAERTLKEWFGEEPQTESNA